MSDARPPSPPPGEAADAGPSAIEPEQLPLAPEKPRGLRRVLWRFGPAVVAIGIAVFAGPLAERWPSKQEVEIAVEAPVGVTRVSLALSPRGELDPIFATTWNFEAGSAPSRIRAEVTTPDGSYDANIAVSREGQPPRDQARRIELDGRRITLFAR